MSEVRPSPSRPRNRPSEASESTVSSLGLRLFDWVLIGFFLALTFLLGVFRLKDTADFYWHLRTGDLIRKTGEIPRVDFYSFTRAGAPWIDLHWLFQVGMSWIFEHGKIPALTLAKCLVTTAALFLLITARRRTWPVWAMILAWLPALQVLSGRMYIRPETMTLLYLSIFLAVLCRWDRRPRLAWVLPPIQALWVNSHGLFILGPIILAFAFIDAALRRRAFSAHRRKWWTTVIPASAATCVACLLNPYGIRGAIYPLELAGTMSSPDFSRTIAELKPIPDFIRETGFGNVPLQIHFVTLALGALSFLVPILAVGAYRLRGARPGIDGTVTAQPSPKSKKGRESDRASKKSATPRKRKGAGDIAETASDDGWRISVFRLLLFAAFSLLSFRATRNSHQFAAVVGAVTAWNFAEWLGFRASQGRTGQGVNPQEGVRARVVTLVALIALTFAVGSGAVYAWTGEGRVIGWGEEPLLFPHDAVKFAGGPGTPDRFASFHNGHASLFIYNFSPERPGGPGKTVYTDPRLEVTGQEQYRRYLDLKDWISKDDPRWQRELEAEGKPSVLTDHEYSSNIGATLLQSGRWRCVWFDPIAAVYVHESYQGLVADHEVDFSARHFRPTAEDEPRGVPALILASKGMRNYASFLNVNGRPDLARPFIWLALDYARRVVAAETGSLEGWKSIAYAELIRDSGAPSPRCRSPYDPIYDLSAMRATYALRRGEEAAPKDFLTLVLLQRTYESRGMLEPLLGVLDRILAASTINPEQARLQDTVGPMRQQIANSLREPAPASWRNLDELDRILAHELEIGRVETAVRLMEQAFPAGRGKWSAVERLSTLLLHLGEPDRARRQLLAAADVPRPALRDARLALCEFVEGRFEEARRLFLQAIEVEPMLFEARYGLAVLEQDDGHAEAAYHQAAAAVESAPNDASRSVVQALVSAVRRFASRERSE